MPLEQLVRDTWQQLSAGDLDSLEDAFSPDARWRAVHDGPWNCESRAAILDVMRRNLDGGLAGEIEEVIDLGDRAIVAFRPREHGPDAWPLDDGIRYVVLTTRGGRITEMKGCLDRASALSDAGAT